VNKNNLLFLLFGLLLGFVVAYLAFDVMSARQPQRRVAGAGGQNPPAAQQPPVPMDQIQQLRAQVKANPEDATAILRLANLNFDIQSFPRARELYERYLELRPETPDILSDLGVCYRALREYEQALAVFHRAQEQAPDHWQALYNEVVILVFDLGRFEEAEEVLQKLQQLQPENPDVVELAAAVARRRNAA
jgi:tetratricopeptide (TPR) repeat protein